MENKNTVTAILLAAICSVIFLGTIQSGVVFAKKYTADLSGDNEVPPSPHLLVEKRYLEQG